MSQFMFAVELRRRCRQPIVVQGYDLPEWGLSKPASDAPISDIKIASHLTCVPPCRLMIDLFKPPLVELVRPIFRIGNYSNPRDFFCFFPVAESVVTIPDDHLLIHIRAGDVSTLTHDKYGPLPIRYYEYLVAQTGLRPLFICEPGHTPYIDLLTATFPKAAMVGGGSTINDFEIIRNAKNVALSVSSFSWMATFLSTKAQQIHLPLAGQFDPADDPTPDFLPLNDDRYIFHNVAREAWSQRYENPIGPRGGFSVASRAAVKALKTAAIVRTAKLSAKIHGGLLKRMAALAYKNRRSD